MGCVDCVDLACVESPYIELEVVRVFGRRCCWRRRVALKSGVEAEDIILAGAEEIALCFLDPRQSPKRKIDLM